MDDPALASTQLMLATKLLLIAATGQEVIQYVPADDFSNLYDINDLMSAYQTSYDASYDPSGLDNSLLTTPLEEESVESLYLTQPSTTTPNGRRTKMEDVD